MVDGGADTLMSPWKLLAVVQGQVDTHDHVAAGVSACEPGLGGVKAQAWGEGDVAKAGEGPCSHWAVGGWEDDGGEVEWRVDGGTLAAIEPAKHTIQGNGWSFMCQSSTTG